MGKYLKQNHRLTVKIINGITNELITEVKNRSWMDVGDFFSDSYVDQILKNTLPEEHLPEKILVLVVGEYNFNKNTNFTR